MSSFLSRYTAKTNTKRAQNSISPSRNPIMPVIAIAVTMMAESIITASSNLMLLYLAARGPTTAARPIANPMLAMLLPTTFPMMICGVSPLTMDVMHSGADDPKARTVSPMTKGATPRRRAIPLAPLTIQSEPKYSITIPIGMPSSIQSMFPPCHHSI